MFNLFLLFVTACGEGPTGAVFNTATPATGTDIWRKEIRQALAAAIDREAISSQVEGKLLIPAYHVVPGNFPLAGEPFLQKYGLRNMVYAQQQLRNAGFTENDPLELELWYPLDYGDPSLEEILKLVKAQIEDTGLAVVELKALPRFEYEEKAAAGELPIYVKEWSPLIIDPLPSLEAFASCGGSLYCNPQLQRLLGEAASSLMTENRADLISQIDVLYAEEVPVIPILWEQELIVYNQGVEGLLIGPADILYYRELRFTDQAQPASGERETIILGSAEEITSLDSADGNTRYDREILSNTGLPLLAYKAGVAELEYGTVLTFPSTSEDGLTYSFFLREDIRFADGTPLRAGMYVDHWQRLASLEGNVPPEYRLLIDRIETQNDLSLTIHLKRPSGLLPALAAYSAMIVSNPKQFAPDEVIEFPPEIDGLGPYRMVSHQPGREMVLAANPLYVLGNVAIPNVIIRFFDNPTLLCDAMEAGEIDIAWGGLGAPENDRLEGLEGIVVERIVKPRLYSLVFSFLDSELQE